MGAGRRTGRTSTQMSNAAQRAVYVWPFSGSIGYARRLAARLGLSDLKIILPHEIEYLRGTDCAEVVVDHAAPNAVVAEAWSLPPPLAAKAPN